MTTSVPDILDPTITLPEPTDAAYRASERAYSGSYPLREPLSIRDIQDKLAAVGFVEYRCDHSTLPNW